MKARTPRIAALSSLLIVALGAPVLSADESITEPETKRKFDAKIAGETKGVTLTCVGVAVREKYFIAVDVYAIAHWVDAKGMKKALDKWKGKTGKALESNQTFYNELCKADVEKRLRLEFVRDAPADKIREAWVDGLKPSFPNFPPYVQRFVDLFQKDLTEKSSIEIRSLPGGTLEVYLDDKKADDWPKDPEFATAVWAIWFQKELSEDKLVSVKKNLISRINKIW